VSEEDKYKDTIDGEKVVLTKKLKRYLSLAQDVASRSEYGKLWHGAVLVKGGSVISTAHNKDKFSSFGHRFRDQDIGPATHHAELSCVSGVHKSKTNGASIFVARVNRKGELRLSKPCAMCNKVLKFTGVKKVYYSTNDGSLKMYKL